MKNRLNPDLHKDIADIVQISAIPSILNVICKITGMRFSAVARVTDEKWITCMSKDDINFGLESGDELVLETTLCNEIRQHHNPIIIEEVAKSDVFCNHRTPLQYGFQSYISYPIFRKDGSFFGTLCAIDPEPAKIDNKETRELFVLYTQLISFHLDALQEVRELTESLRQERHIGELRETFIAVLGHDLRNPVSTTRMCADVLLQMDLPELANRQASTIKATSYRMQELIDNLLDFAKGHLGEGIQLDLENNNQALKKSIKQISKEIKTIDLNHEINLSIELDEEVECDINRISQLYSNLLGNAMKHGAVDKPIFTEVKSEKGIFSILVSNSGKKIPEKKMLNLFRPFFTTNSANNKSGLGLGLYISSEIAKAHGGKMEVTSTDKKTSFRFSMPRKKLRNLKEKYNGQL
ncbi:GAF domain-containing sensor histidine kinase [Aequorivita capsosiphonis]|uniref:GAF domain-containing sensor histidine kinase n=1 Tax=Aequorivita capsosiphonis TaxID=487317 RepID=UPI0003F735C0|nr:GAF domain-containing sensor histidine kinase [Aequorivita capsosiphonis]